MKQVVIRKVKRFGLGKSKELVFLIEDTEEIETINDLIAVAKRLKGFSFEIFKVKSGS